MKKAAKNEYALMLNDIKRRMRESQYEALKEVNKSLINLYWDIGARILISQQKHGWGKSVVETLANDLQREFPGIGGFSASNLWRAKLFHETYKNNEKLAPLVREISWSHNIIIIEKCKNEFEREFYIKMSKKFGWTKNVLIHHIENRSFEKTLNNQTNFDKEISEDIRNQAKLAVKDEYTFSFLELGEEHRESEFELGLISKINKFLIEMGGVFTFVGNQYRLEIGGDEFFIDILLYHRRLKCLVAVELKTGKFIPEYIGKMQFYLAVLDDTVREKDENPSIGIIICKDKNRMVVEYALRETRKPIAVSKYKITDRIPENLRKELPNPDQMKILLDV